MSATTLTVLVTGLTAALVIARTESRARRCQGRNGLAENLGPRVKSPGLGFSPEVLGDGRTLVFESWQRPDQVGGLDAGSNLYLAQVRRGGRGEPRCLGPGVNSNRWGCHPTVTSGGRWVCFVRQDATADFYRVRGDVLLP